MDKLAIDDENGLAAGSAGEPYPREKGVLIIFHGLDSKSSQNLRSREVNATVPAVPQWLNWSEIPIGFDRSDHIDHVPHPGKHALVVDPQVSGFKLRKVLMDGGSNINILYADTLKQMQIPESKLRPSGTIFHGIVPGKSGKPLGQIALDVMFGKPDNFCIGTLAFEVVDFRSTYHPILGRPAYAKFMARLCYVYLKLKIPGPKGVVTIAGNFERSNKCAIASADIAGSLITAKELATINKSVDTKHALLSKKVATKSAFQSAKDTKTVQIHPEDPFKMVQIGIDLKA